MVDTSLSSTTSSGRSAAGFSPEDRATSSHRDYIQDLNNMSAVQVVILIQFICAAALTIFAVVGVSINQRVGFLLLLALLQFLIALPGFAYHFTRKQRFYVSYMIFQSITLGSEIIWFIYILATETYTVISIIILVILIIVQASAILAATLFKNVFVNLKDVKVIRHHPERVDDKIEEGDEGSAVTPKSTKKTSSPLEDEPSSRKSRRRRWTSRELEQGVDQSRRVARGKQKREESLRKFKEGRKKMRKLAQQLREKRDRERSKKTDGTTSEKQSTGVTSEGARSFKESSRSAEDDKKKDEVCVSPLATAKEG